MQSKTFRLFISSTFSDFTKEREILHKRVFPKIDKYCNENGFSFQPIDLRWGVSNEAQLDQKTLEVCLEEVRACKHFPHPNFLIMAGDRYGYVPCPYMIEKYEFEKIKSVTSNEDKLKALEYWYKLDENQIYTTTDENESTAYILQPRTNEYIDYPNWEKQEKILREVLQKAADIIFEDKSTNNKEYQKYFVSATEAEVVEGICDYRYKTNAQEDCNERVDKEFIFGYLRTLKNVDGKYIDQNQKLIEKANKFKASLTETLKVNNILYTTFESIEEYEDNELQKFEDYLVEKLKIAIDTQKKDLDETSIVQQELYEQQKFKNDKLKGFQGREKTLLKIDSYIVNNKNQPLVIYGPSGMGKSALISQAINQAEEKLDKNYILYRFVGATAKSTSLRNLLISICDELQEKHIIEKIAQYEFNEIKFYEQINEALSSIKTPVVLFIDALDQIDLKSNVNWIPKLLSNNLKIVLSILKDEKYKEDSYYYELLIQRYSLDNFIDITEDNLDNVQESLLINLLEHENRRLSNTQLDYVLNKWSKTNYSPLYLKIAIEEMKHWNSFDKVEDNKLSDNIENVIKEFIENLTTLYHHDKIFVDKVFGYINTSKDGLNEKELLDIISEDLEDEKDFKKAIINEFHEPIKRQNYRRDNKEELILPISIWSRLHTQLKPFIIERDIDGQYLMKFFHRQFNTLLNKYFIDTEINLYTKLSNYFISYQDTSKTWSERYYYPHMLSELPYQLFYSKQYEKLKEVMFNLEFVGSVYDSDKSDSFKNIINNIKELPNVTESELYLWKSFYLEKDKLIQQDKNIENSKSLFQAAYEDGKNSPLTNKAKELLSQGKVDWYWLKPEWEKDVSRLGIIKEINLTEEIINNKKNINFILKNGNNIEFFLEEENQDQFIIQTMAVLEKDINGNIISKKYNKVYTGKYKQNNTLNLNNGNKITWYEFTSHTNHYFLELYDNNDNLQYLMGSKCYTGEVFELNDGSILAWSEDGSSIIIWDLNLVNTDSLTKGKRRSLPINTMFHEGDLIITWDNQDTVFDFAATWNPKTGENFSIYRGDFQWEIDSKGLVDIEKNLIKSSPYNKNDLMISWKEYGDKIKIVEHDKKTIIMPNNFEKSKLLRVSNYVYFSYLNSYIMKYSIQKGNQKIEL